MEGDAFDVLDAAQKLVEGDVALLEACYLRTDAVVGYRTIDDVVVVKRQAVGLCSVVIDEVRPFLSIFLESLITELSKERLVEFIDIDNGSGFLELGAELCHLQGLLFVVGQIEGVTEVLVGLDLASSICWISTVEP